MSNFLLLFWECVLFTVNEIIVGASKVSVTLTSVSKISTLQPVDRVTSGKEFLSCIQVSI